MKRLLLAAFAAAASLGCQRESTMVPANALVDAADPPDDGGSSRGSAGGLQHAQALEALVRFPIGTVQSADGRVRMSLPAGAHWRRVTFWGFDAYTGFRFGQDHHAIVGVTLFEPLRGEGDRGCLAAFAVTGRTMFAAIAPLGSLALIIGWAVLVWAGCCIH